MHDFGMSLEVEEGVRRVDTALHRTLVTTLLRMHAHEVALEAALGGGLVRTVIHEAGPLPTNTMHRLNMSKPVEQDREGGGAIIKQTDPATFLVVHETSVRRQDVLELERPPTARNVALPWLRCTVNTNQMLLEVGGGEEGGVALGVVAHVFLLRPVHTKHVGLQQAALDGGEATRRVRANPVT